MQYTDCALDGVINCGKRPRGAMVHSGETGETSR